jgi:hypothetical protein
VYLQKWCGSLNGKLGKALFRDLMVKDEPVMVFHDADPEPKLKWKTVFLHGGFFRLGCLGGLFDPEIYGHSLVSFQGGEFNRQQNPAQAGLLQGLLGFSSQSAAMSR